MKSPYLAACLSIALAAAVGNNSAQALSLSNGSFELPTAGTPSTKFSNGTSNLVWEGSDGGVEIFSGTFCSSSDCVSAYQGAQWAEVQNNNQTDSITQTITGITPGRFAFSFAHAARPGTGQNTLNFKIIETGSPLNVLFSQDYQAPDTNWVLNQGVFATQATSVDFIFTGVSTGISPVQPGNGNFIDAVTAVEVPGPLPLMGAATAFAYSRKIRRRITQAKA
jgi:hypothetical protein